METPEISEISETSPQLTSVGFDIGLRNLGWCMLRYYPNTDANTNMDVNDNFVCLGMGIMDVNGDNATKVSLKQAVENMVGLLDEMWPTLLSQVDFVNIEQQPNGRQFGPRRDNSPMIALSHALQVYFMVHGKPVEFISPRSKLTVYKGPPLPIATRSTSTHTVNKKTAEAQAKHMLKTSANAENQKWYAWVHSLAKADDVCDAFLQCLYALRRKYPTIAQK